MRRAAVTRALLEGHPGNGSCRRWWASRAARLSALHSRHAARDCLDQRREIWVMLGNVGQATDIADTLKRSYGGSPAVLASPISMLAKSDRELSACPHRRLPQTRASLAPTELSEETRRADAPFAMAAGREFSTEKASSHCGRAPGLPTSGNVNSIPAPANVVHRVCSRSSDAGGVSLYSSSRLMTAHDNPLRSANCFTDQFSIPHAARNCLPVSFDAALRSLASIS